MEYTKPFQSFDELATSLIKKGLEADRDELILRLQNTGYYRLSGYWHIYKKRDEKKFWEGTTLQQIWDIYVFDRQFRLLVLDAIERVEIYMRSHLAHYLAQETGPFGFLERNNLPRLTLKNYIKFMNKCVERYKDAKRGETFAKHFNEKYGDCHEMPPYWILVNLMDFGMVVTLYRGAPVTVRQKIATDLGLPTRIVDSWLITLNTVRNICAHYGRLWNRIIGTPPIIPRAKQWKEPYTIKNDKIFGTLTILSYLLEYAAPTTDWRKRLVYLLGNLSTRDQERMGFEGGWKQSPLWKPYM